MGLVRRILADVVTPNRGAFLSFGILGTLWAASSGFSAAIEALNVAYDVQDDRPFWKTRPLAVGLALTIGDLLLLTLAVMIVGPRFGEARKSCSSLQRVCLFVAVHSLVYRDCIHHSRCGSSLLPGSGCQAAFSGHPTWRYARRGCWIALSYLLGFYFLHFANFNKTYGTLGAGIALMVWLYWTGFAILVGAELNCELAKSSSGGRIAEKHEPPPITKIDFAT